MKFKVLGMCVTASTMLLPGSGLSQEQAIAPSQTQSIEVQTSAAAEPQVIPTANIRQTHEGLQGTLWMQGSLEYDVSTTQCYNNAKAVLPKLLSDKTFTASIERSRRYSQLPPAIVMDVDETVLSNAAFQARIVQSNGTFKEDDWKAWVSEGKANAIAGAAEFIHFARSRGVKVFYVTNRTADGEAATVKNLSDELSMAVTPEDVLCKNEEANWGSDKTSRREWIAGAFRIVMMFGDDFNDFAYLGKVSPSERKRRGMKFANRLGHSWFLLPNPLYGNWDKAIYNYDYSVSDADVLQLKHDLLRTDEEPKQ